MCPIAYTWLSPPGGFVTDPLLMNRALFGGTATVRLKEIPLGARNSAEAVTVAEPLLFQRRSHADHAS